MIVSKGQKNVAENKKTGKKKKIVNPDNYLVAITTEHADLLGLRTGFKTMALRETPDEKRGPIKHKE